MARLNLVASCGACGSLDSELQLCQVFKCCWPSCVSTWVGVASESSVVGEQNWASDCNPCVSSFIFLYLSFPRAYPTLTKTHLSCPLSQIRSCISSRTGPRSSTLFRDRIRSDIRTRLGPARLGCGFPGFPSAFVAAVLRAPAQSLFA